jgi:hypothetical protein
MVAVTEMRGEKQTRRKETDNLQLYFFLNEKKKMFSNLKYRLIGKRK